MRRHVLILGAGFGGLELATRLSGSLADEVHVTLVDKDDAFVFGFSKLDVMFGRRTLADVRIPYGEIAKAGVEFRQELVTSIDPTARRVVTDGGAYEPDILVVALGADYEPSATPGFVDAGHEYYSVPGAERLREVLPSIEKGVVVVAILGTPFKCPPAPFEGALLLHDHFVGRGVRDAVEIRMLSPMDSPIPVSPETSTAITTALDERGIGMRFGELVTSLDPASHTA
ncbi:MAG: NAD(P)/FAD-dependent oxidoreductase, partial [Candidatus Binatia bacterium]